MVLADRFDGLVEVAPRWTSTDLSFLMLPEHVASALLDNDEKVEFWAGDYHDMLLEHETSKELSCSRTNS